MPPTDRPDYSDPFLAAAAGHERPRATEYSYAQPEPRSDGLLHVERHRARRDAVGPFDYASLDAPTVSRREAMAYTGPDPTLMRACETIAASIGLSLKAAGALPVGVSMEEHRDIAIAAGVRNGVTAASCDLAGETERLRGQLREAIEYLDHLRAFGRMTMAVGDDAMIEGWRAAVGEVGK